MNRLSTCVFSRLGCNRTFSAFVMTACAFAGRPGAESEAWQLGNRLQSGNMGYNARGKAMTEGSHVHRHCGACSPRYIWGRLLRQQTVEQHIFTDAASGGRSWPEWPGSVPDAEDTARALLALRRLGPLDGATRIAGPVGVQWPVNLQNSDGGIPTFCREWAPLAFDRSCPDITAHPFQAFGEWYDAPVPGMRGRGDAAVHSAVTHLTATQQKEGLWLSLWCGNQETRDATNLMYVTGAAVHALRKIMPGRLSHLAPLLEKGVGWARQFKLVTEDGVQASASDPRLRRRPSP